MTKTTASPTAGPDEARDATVLHPPNLLKAKLTRGRLDLELSLDETTLARVEAEIARLVPAFLDWVEESLDQIETAYARLAGAPGPGSPDLRAIVERAFEIAGQGSTFSYPLLTAIAESLHDFTAALSRLEPAQTALIGLHIDALRVVLREGLEGDGGNDGAELMTMLRRATAKHLAGG